MLSCMCATSRTKTPRRNCRTSRTSCASSASIRIASRPGKPALIEVWNKIDRLDADQQAWLRNLAERRPADQRPVLVSAITGEGIDALGAAIEVRLAAGRVLIELVLEAADGAGVSWLHRHTEVIHKAVDTNPAVPP